MWGRNRFCLVYQANTKYKPNEKLSMNQAK